MSAFIANDSVLFCTNLQFFFQAAGPQRSGVPLLSPPAGEQWRVQSRAVQLYQHKSQLALQIKQGTRGNWRPVQGGGGVSGSTPIAHQSNLVLQAETSQISQEAAVGKEREQEGVTHRVIFMCDGKTRAGFRFE